MESNMEKPTDQIDCSHFEAKEHCQKMKSSVKLNTFGSCHDINFRQQTLDHAKIPIKHIYSWFAWQPSCECECGCKERCLRTPLYGNCSSGNRKKKSRPFLRYGHSSRSGHTLKGRLMLASLWLSTVCALHKSLTACLAGSYTLQCKDCGFMDTDISLHILSELISCNVPTYRRKNYFHRDCNAVPSASQDSFWRTLQTIPFDLLTFCSQSSDEQSMSILQLPNQIRLFKHEKMIALSVGNWKRKRKRIPMTAFIKCYGRLGNVTHVWCGVSVMHRILLRWHPRVCKSQRQ